MWYEYIFVGYSILFTISFLVVSFLTSDAIFVCLFERRDYSLGLKDQLNNMGRGVSYGGGQSSLGYLFGSGEAPAPKPATNNAQPEVQAVNDAPPSKPVEAPKSIDPNKPAGINSHSTEGQNTGNFITVIFVSSNLYLIFFSKCQY